MPKIPLEDSFADVIAKTQRGLKLSDEKLCALAEVSAAGKAMERRAQFPARFVLAALVALSSGRQLA